MIETKIYLDDNQSTRNNTSAYLKKTKVSDANKFSWSKRAKKVSIKMGGNISLNIDEKLY